MAKDSGSSRTDTIVKVMLVFFISLLSFSVGTFVGKQVSDSDHRRMALESEMKDGRDVASQETEAANNSKVSEKDVDNLAEEFVNKEKNAGTEAQAPADDAAAPKTDGKESADGYKSYSHGAKDDKAEKGKDATAEKKVDAVADKVANNEAASDGQPETRKPSSTLPGVASTSVGKFTVQVHSFATEDEAKAEASDLKSKGWNAFYIPAAVAGHTWYRVSIGLFNNQNSAQAFRRDYLKESGTKTAIVTKIVQ